jgi:hypothetical protein
MKISRRELKRLVEAVLKEDVSGPAVYNLPSVLGVEYQHVVDDGMYTGPRVKGEENAILKLNPGVRTTIFVCASVQFGVSIGKSNARHSFDSLPLDTNDIAIAADSHSPSADIEHEFDNFDIVTNNGKFNQACIIEFAHGDELDKLARSGYIPLRIEFGGTHQRTHDRTGRSVKQLVGITVMTTE